MTDGLEEKLFQAVVFLIRGLSCTLTILKKGEEIYPDRLT